MMKILYIYTLYVVGYKRRLRLYH